jgi:hypothetical protein
MISPVQINTKFTYLYSKSHYLFWDIDWIGKNIIQEETKDFLLYYAFDLDRITTYLLTVIFVIIFTRLISNDGYNLILHRRVVRSW